jgi:hypothetical protein
MRPLWAAIAIPILTILPCVQGVEKAYVAGKILDIQQKARTRVLYYLVNTPITQDDPYYEVSVKVGDTNYVGEYTPRHTDDTLPEDWKPETPVQARIEKHHIFLKRPGGGDVQLVILKHSASETNEKALPLTTK